MTPLETNKNRDLSNVAYAPKREVYEKSDFKITKAIAENYDTWDENKVDTRQKRLADTAAGVWRIDFGDA